MPTPIPPNSRSVEVRSTVPSQEGGPNVHKRPQPYPGMEDRMYPIHDRGMCEWISDAFWYVIDVLDSIYNYVVDKILCLLEKLNIIKPREAPNPPFVFSNVAKDVIENFSSLSPEEQIDCIKDAVHKWKGDARESSELIHVLAHQLSRPLKHALVEFSEGDLPEERLGDYLLGLSTDQYDEFRDKTFIKFSLDIYEYELELDEVPKGEVSLLFMLKIMETVPHPTLDKGIDVDWINGKLQDVKKKLTDEDWGCLLQAYNQRVDEEVVLEAFKKIFEGISYGREEFIPLLKQALYHVPTQIHRICKEICEGNTENRLALFQNNTVWAQAFLEAYLEPRIQAQLEADPDGEIQDEIVRRLQARWETKQKEDEFDGDAIQEEPFKQGILAAVTTEVKKEVSQSLRKVMDGQGWFMDDPEALLAKLDEEADAASIHAAIRAALPRI